MYKNKIYFGDNLEVMRDFERGGADLVCTDPPFNSGRNYNIFLKSKAQKRAFTDIWKWDESSEETRSDIEVRAQVNETYKDIHEALIGYDYILQHKQTGPKGAMRSYLTFMAPRIVEMHRILKDTGSIYLHCDPSASHYLKGMMDVVFGEESFQNEVIWSYRRWSGKAKRYQRMHDVIFFYSKTDDHIWNYPMEPKSKNSRMFKQWNEKDPKTGKMKTYYDKSISDTETNMRDVWEIGRLQSRAHERTGYPTQKPIKLYKRMIEASSNPGDIILDPFAGCGTTLDAAEELERNWIGIDITLLSLEPMQKRLLERHALRPHIDYEISGYPTNMEEVHLLVNNHKRYHDFSDWAVTRLGLKPTKNIGDDGYDGVGHFILWSPEEMEEKECRIMAEVKSGKPNKAQLRAFCHSMTKNKATAGVFITLDKVSAGMREEAEAMGKFEHNGRTYPRLQFWQITQEYFNDPTSINRIIKLPRNIKSSKKAERYIPDRQTEMSLAAG